MELKLVETKYMCNPWKPCKLFKDINENQEVKGLHQVYIVYITSKQNLANVNQIL